MVLGPLKTWLVGWFDPKDRDLQALRYGQLMHVFSTGKSALASGIATLIGFGAIAAQWEPVWWVAVFLSAGTALSLIAEWLFRKAAKDLSGPDDYRRANAYYVAHSLFTVAAMTVVGMIWVPGNIAANVFVMLALVVCATVRASYQAAHLPSAVFSLIYFVVAIVLCLSEGTLSYLLITMLGLVIMAMLADLNWRMHKTVEAMLKLSQSERALLEEQQNLVAQLRDASAAKSQFMARMSHELRTPLNAVIGFSEILQHETYGPIGAPAYLDYAKHIHGSGTHLLQLINDILDLSKMEAGRYVLREGTVDPREVVDDAFAMVRLKADEAGVRLVNAIPRGIELRADEMALRQVAINLASNAVKFTPKGGLVQWRGGFTAAGDLLLSIEDTGCGIPAGELEWVFEPFGQSTSSYKAVEKGTGLGLPIVRNLMALHSGTATIASTEGEGTVVTITFPANRLVSAAVRDAA